MSSRHAYWAGKAYTFFLLFAFSVSLSNATSSMALEISDFLPGEWSLPGAEDLPVSVEEGLGVEIPMPILQAQAAAQSGSVVGMISGEFNVSPSGAATYSIPITVPPGTAGMEPDLSIQYSSQGQNGLLGIGWSLGGLSAISRCPASLVHDGRIDPVDFDSLDRLCLDGQRLVSTGSNYGKSGNEYRTEIDSYSRIKQYQDDINGAIPWFTVETKSGLTYRYGLDDAAFKINTRHGFRTFVWAVKRIDDTFGNYIEFNYERDNSGEYYLDRIDYTGNRDQGTLPYASVRFLYENRNDTSERYIADGNERIRSVLRLEKIQTYNEEYKVREYILSYEYGEATGRSRLIQIDECSNNGYCISPTQFTWSEKQPGFLGPNQNFEPSPHDLTKSDGGVLSELIDVNGDAVPDWILGVFEYGEGVFIETLLSTLTGWNEQTANAYYLPTYHHVENAQVGEFGDVNGDGLVDWILSWRQGWTGVITREVYLNSPSGFQSQPSSAYRPPQNTYLYEIPELDNDAPGWQKGSLIDLNGDRLADIVMAAHGQGWVTWRNVPDCVPQCWDSSTALTLPDYLFGSDGRRLGTFVELNGDGLPDYIYSYTGDHYPNRTMAYINTGEAWVRAPGYDLQSGENTIFFNKSSYGELVDINGDGLHDLVSNQIVRLNTGYGWGTEDARKQMPKQPYFLGQRRAVFADISGDGLPDLIYSQENYSREVYINTSWKDCTGQKCHWDYDETGVYTVPGPLFTPEEYNKVQATLADVNGDGLLDSVIGRNGNRLTHLNKGAIPDMVKTVVNGFDARIEIDYKPITDPDVYSPGAFNASGGNFDTAWQQYVVSQSRRTNSIGELSATSYTYENARANRLGRGFLGFGRIKVTDEVTDIAEFTDYRTDFPCVGMETGKITRVAGAKGITSRLWAMKSA